MNITILTNKDLASCLALNYLLPRLRDHRPSVFLSSRVGSKPLPSALQQLKFIEQDLFNQIVFPVLGAAERKSSHYLGFDQLGKELEGRLQELNQINEGDGLERFIATEPDLVLSIRYGVILKSAALAVPRHGVLNLHSGKLPDYKGVMASFWALLHEEKELGTTLHYIDDSSIDTGRIVGTSVLPVEPEQSYLWHVLSLYPRGCDTMIEAVAAIDRGDALSASAQPPGGHYFSFPADSDLERFASQGWRLWDPKDVLDCSRNFFNGS